jgi:pSer/pThr/pTyr-binding forkhead associated (FHA) protein
MGLSRRHALIRQTVSGYEIIDLASTNGTWLNDERLVPYTPYPLQSGSQLRLSRIRLFIFHRLAAERKK